MYVHVYVFVCVCNGAAAAAMRHNGAAVCSCLPRVAEASSSSSLSSGSYGLGPKLKTSRRLVAIAYTFHHRVSACVCVQLYHLLVCNFLICFFACFGFYIFYASRSQNYGKLKMFYL